MSECQYCIRADMESAPLQNQYIKLGKKQKYGLIVVLEGLLIQKRADKIPRAFV